MKNWLLAQAGTFAEKWGCTGSFPKSRTTLEPMLSEKLCTVADLISLGYVALRFTVLALAPAIVVFSMLYGAILVTLYGANPNFLKQGKDIIYNAFWGLVIVWGAWTILNTAFYTLNIKLPCNGVWYTITTCPQEK